MVRVDRKRLREVLVRAAILSSEQYRGVRLCLSQGQIDVMANNAEQEGLRSHWKQSSWVRTGLK